MEREADSNRIVDLRQMTVAEANEAYLRAIAGYAYIDPGMVQREHRPTKPFIPIMYCDPAALTTLCDVAESQRRFGAKRRFVH